MIADAAFAQRKPLEPLEPFQNFLYKVRVIMTRTKNLPCTGYVLAVPAEY